MINGTTNKISNDRNNKRVLIINGRMANKGRYPYFVTLRHYGGGALIAPDIVLTAGHTKPRHRDHVRPHIGTYSFVNDTRYVDYDEYNIRQMVRHTQFVYVNENEFRYDFTILQLDGLSSHDVITINRSPDIPIVGQDVIAMGVGIVNTKQQHSLSDVLMEVTLNTISNDDCTLSKSEKRNVTYDGRIDASMMCTTGGPHNERDSCDYDSGSPIIIPGNTMGNHTNHEHRHHDNDDLLVGLVSWGEACADRDFPAVNARVSTVSDWIDDVVCQLSNDPPDDFGCQRQRQRGRWGMLHHMTTATTRLCMTIVICLVGLVLGMVVVVVVRRRQGRHKKKTRKMETLEEQESLCESSSSSDDYQAVEIT